MKTILKNYANFTPGVNPSRIEKKIKGEDVLFYDQTSFEMDFSRLELYFEQEESIDIGNGLERGDVVISHASQTATIVSAENAGKILSLNFVKVTFDTSLLDKAYFLFLFNELHSVQRQKERELQGSSTVQRLTVKSIGNLEIPEVPIEVQQKIGAVYIESQKFWRSLEIYRDLMRQFTISVIENHLEEYDDKL